MSRQGEQAPTAVAPAPDVPVVRLELPTAVLVAALARLAAADTRAEVAAAVPGLLVDEPGVRGCAVVVRDGAQVVVLGAAGYDCGTMDAGSTLPLDAGLPVTEAVRSGRPVERGSGPSWVAVPFSGRQATGALLLSLVVAPPEPPGGAATLSALARALGDALDRAHAQETAFLDLALVTATLAQPPSPSERGVAIRRLPLDGVVGADVVLRLDDGGATWLVVADVRRSGLEAAVLARSVHTAVTAVVPHVREPTAVVVAVRSALAGSGPGRPAAVSVARVRDGEVTLSTSDAPPVVLLSAGRVLPLDVDDQGSAVVRPPADAVLVLHTDGLTARAGRTLTFAELAAGGPAPDLDAFAAGVVRRADAVAPASDDVAVLVARVADLR